MPRTPTDADTEDDRNPGGVAAVLFPAVSLLVALLLIGLWAWLDDEHRAEQAAVVVVVLAAAAGALLVSLARHRNRP